MSLVALEPEQLCSPACILIGIVFEVAKLMTKETSDEELRKETKADYFWTFWRGEREKVRSLGQRALGERL